MPSDLPDGFAKVTTGYAVIQTLCACPPLQSIHRVDLVFLIFGTHRL